MNATTKKTRSSAASARGAGRKGRVRKQLSPAHGTGSAKSARVEREPLKQRQLPETCEAEIEQMRQRIDELVKENVAMQAEVAKVGERGGIGLTKERQESERTLTEARLFLLNSFIASNWFTNNKFTTRSTLEKDTRFMAAFVKCIQVPSDEGHLYQKAIVRAVMKKVTALRAHVKKKIRDGYEGKWN